MLNQRVAAIKSKNVFVYLFLQTQHVLNYVIEKSRATNQPNLSIVDLANLMEIELYKIPIDDLLSMKFSLLQFQGKIKLINNSFSREFSSGLFNSIGISLCFTFFEIA